MPALVPDIKDADPMAAALLIECRGQTPKDLQARINEVTTALNNGDIRFGNKLNIPKKLSDYPFTSDAEVILN